MITQDQFRILYEYATQTLVQNKTDPNIYNILVWANEQNMITLNEELLSETLEILRQSLLSQEKARLQARLDEIEQEQGQ